MTQSLVTAAEPAPSQAREMFECLAFTLGREEYGIDIQCVQELRGYDSVTRIAGAPHFIKGVINLRGVIVPVIDMRIRFEVGVPNYDGFTVVVILNVDNRTVGMVVDSVSDVITLSKDQMRSPPDVAGAIGTSFVRGLGTIKDRLLILLDIQKLMASEEMGLVEKAAA